GPAEPLGADYTSRFPKTDSGVRVHVEAKAAVSASRSELLILLEDVQSPESVTCTVQVDGQTTDVTSSDSESGWGASVLVRPEHWVFFRAALPIGEHNVQVDLLSSNALPRVSCWLWGSRPGDVTPSTYPNALPQPESVSLKSQPLFESSAPPSAEAEPIHVEPPMERINGVFLDTLDPVVSEQGYGTLQKNRSVWEKPMIISGQHYMRGLGTHAPARIVYDLAGQYSRFQAWAGADAATTPTVTFEVRTDGVSRWKSNLMQRGDAAQRVDVDITGAKSLELIVGDGGNGIGADHADWADARLLR
ncbi:MAG: NPCBM/NEW2 domain-containing protein, partial [Candidatus Hydrogenedentales bacterium]